MSTEAITKIHSNHRGFQPGVVSNPNGRPRRELDFAELAHAFGERICPYAPGNRRYIDVLVEQAWDDATDSSSAKVRVASREWLTNRLYGLPRAQIDTRLDIEAHINADSLEHALRPILEAQKAMLSEYRRLSSVECTHTLLQDGSGQSPNNDVTPDLASK